MSLMCWSKKGRANFAHILSTRKKAHLRRKRGFRGAGGNHEMLATICALEMDLQAIEIRIH